MSAAEVMASADAVPANVAEGPAVDPPAALVDDEEEELVFKARGKRVRAAADVKAGDAGEDTSPRGPIDASEADSPPKSSDDEAGDNETGLPGKKRLKLRTKGAAEAAKAAGFARREGDSELEDEGAPEEADDAFYGYAEDDEEAALEMRLRDKGTLSDDEADEEGDEEAEEESEESDLDDSEDDFELDDFDTRDARAPSKRGKKASFAPAARAPPPENETEQEKEARMAREKAETAAMQQEIMREASRRARLSGYHVAPDRDPFAYRKIFAHVAARVECLGLPAPPPEVVFAEDDDDEEEIAVAREPGVEEDDFEEEDFDADDDDEANAEANLEVVELEVDADEAEAEDALLDDLDDLDGVAAAVAAARAKKASGELYVSPEAAVAELAAQKAKEEAAAAEDAAAPEEEEDDLSEEETREMTRKERLKQLKKAKAFFKADAAARRKTRAGEAFEDEAEMSDDGGHTSDEEEVEVEERTGADGRVIKRRATKRADGLLDREELEEMVDYIDFDDVADDDERRAQKRAAAHARFEEERDDEELRRMKEALENGFRRKEKGGALDGGPDGWQRRRRAGAEDSDDDDLGIDVPDRAWEAVELSSDDDGEWAERAARRKAAAAAAEAQRTAAGDSISVRDAEDSQVPSARDVGFDSQDFRSMIDAGKKGRRARTRRGVDAAVAALDHANGIPAPVRSTAGGLPRANSANVAGAGAATGPGLERHSSTSFLGRGNGSRSGAGASGAGLVRSASLGGGGASRSFVFGACGDSQSMWDKDAEERSAAERPATTLREMGGDENARAGFGWAPRERMAAPSSGPASRLGNGGGSQSLFGMLEASQDWDEVLGKGDSLARGVKAAKNVRLRPVQR